uniref:Fatty-acid and retinol-binding protein 1 n=1 Tax=Haemonchus contortus TaxID=6289 RepID=A0A7I4YFA8_HAECO
MTFTVPCLLLISALVNAAPKTPFSRAELDSYLATFNAYKGYIPKEIQTIFTGLSEKTKNEMVAIVNEIEDGKLKIPNNAPELIDYFKKRTPELGERVGEAMDKLKKNINKLSPLAKKRFNMWLGRVFEAVSAPPDKIVNRLAKLIADFYEGYTKTDQSIKNEMRNIWPEVYTLLESDFAKALGHGARMFVDSGLSIDIRRMLSAG